MPQGSLTLKRKRKGSGHGRRNHRHASGNGLVRYYYGAYQAILKQRLPSRALPMYASVREAFEAAKREAIGRLAEAVKYLRPSRPAERALVF